MLGKTHMIAGVCVGELIAIHQGLGFEATVVTVCGATLGSLIPDIDHRNSKISQKVKLVSTVIRAVARHRGIIHDPVLYVLVYLGLWVCSRSIAMSCTPLFLGIASHLILDAATTDGIPVLKWRLRTFGISTDGLIERTLRLFFTVAAYALLAVKIGLI